MASVYTSYSVIVSIESLRLVGPVLRSRKTGWVGAPQGEGGTGRKTGWSERKEGKKNGVI